MITRVETMNAKRDGNDYSTETREGGESDPDEIRSGAGAGYKNVGRSIIVIRRCSTEVARSDGRSVLRSFRNLCGRSDCRTMMSGAPQSTTSK